MENTMTTMYYVRDGKECAYESPFEAMAAATQYSQQTSMQVIIEKHFFRDGYIDVRVQSISVVYPDGSVELFMNPKKNKIKNE